jgi:prepilin-type N-terminal cleavage/methylation domain-containing protein/prepilin-type processing-associated H-X9-DG protein
MDRTQRFRFRRGFTLVELLVVIAIIGVLVAMLLPAVNSAREAARRMQCTNNLHNLALAMHNYHDTMKVFPNSHFYFPSASGTDNICSVATNCEEWGWGALILPYIEQQNLYNQLGVTTYSLHHVLAKKNPGLPNPTDMLQTKIAIYRCPSDSSPNGDLLASERSFSGGLGTSSGGLGAFVSSISNYMTNRGTRNNNQQTSDTHGIFMESKAKGIQDITDGTSNTLMLGERDTQICRSGTWVGVRNPAGNALQGIYNVTANVRVRLNAPDPPIPWNDTTGRQGCYEGFSSLHVGGANFALCDGSVRFVNNNIEFKLGTGVNVGGAVLNDYDVHQPRDPRYTNVYSVYSRLGRRNDGFPNGDY